MALFECPDCEHEVSTKALSCPNCGRRFRGERSVLSQVITGTAIAIFIIVIFGALCFVGLLSVFDGFTKEEPRVARTLPSGLKLPPVDDVAPAPVEVTPRPIATAEIHRPEPEPKPKETVAESSPKPEPHYGPPPGDTIYDEIQREKAKYRAIEEKQEQAYYAKMVKEREQKAEGVLRLGKNLEKAGKSLSALGYYRKVAKDYPNTFAAEEAKKAIERLTKSKP